MSINIIFLFLCKFYPTMDGPAHLYNSNLINQLIINNSFIEEFHKINTFLIPNWTSHFILSFFRFFFSGWLAEKFLLIIYISGMALSFRYLIKVLKPENMTLSILIFPFIYSFLFHLGFYNNSLSFIFFFLALAYWVNNYKSNQLSLYLVTGILLICTYFSNILTLAFLGITLGSSILLIEAESNSIKSKQFIRLSINRLIRLALCALPSMVLMLYFFLTVKLPSTSQEYNSTELIKWINDVRSLIIYYYNEDEIITEQFLHILILLYGLSFIADNTKAKLINRFLNSKQTIIYLPLLLSLILFFTLPNASSAGMMSDRICLMFFILLIVLVATQTIPSKIQSLFSILIILLHLNLLYNHSKVLKELNKDAVSINETAKHIEANKIVLPVNLSDNWLQAHFSNYLGTDKPLIILENYETEVGWFPIVWNSGSPNILLGDKQMINGLSWHQNTNAKVHQIDYIFFYGNMAKKEGDNYKELNGIIESNYKLEYESENKYVKLYKKID